MRRLALVLPLILIATTALFAQTHSRATMPVQPNVSPNTVTGIVSSVNGTLVLLAGGLVTVDVSGAKVSGDIAPGALLVAVLKPGEVAPNAPLPAAYVGVTSVAQVSLTGPVTAVDLAGSTLTLLGRTIKVTPQTTFSSMMMTFKAITLADILPGHTVGVDANASGGALVASHVVLLEMHAVPLPSVIHGTVKSIGTTSWVITVGSNDVIVTVNGNTKIVGDPKVGDTVDVIVGGDGVALSILKEPLPLPGPNEIHMTGWVKSIGATQWTIGGPPGSMAPDFLVQVTASTKIVGDPKVGDRVDVVGQMGHGGIVANSITKLTT